jgi:hypothetical protein
VIATSEDTPTLNPTNSCTGKDDLTASFSTEAKEEEDDLTGS